MKNRLFFILTVCFCIVSSNFKSSASSLSVIPRVLQKSPGRFSFDGLPTALGEVQALTDLFLGAMTERYGECGRLDLDNEIEFRYQLVNLFCDFINSDAEVPLIDIYCEVKEEMQQVLHGTSLRYGLHSLSNNIRKALSTILETTEDDSLEQLKPILGKITVFNNPSEYIKQYESIKVEIKRYRSAFGTSRADSLLFALEEYHIFLDYIRVLLTIENYLFLNNRPILGAWAQALLSKYSIMDVAWQNIRTCLGESSPLISGSFFRSVLFDENGLFFAEFKFTRERAIASGFSSKFTTLTCQMIANGLRTELGERGDSPKAKLILGLFLARIMPDLISMAEAACDKNSELTRDQIKESKKILHQLLWGGDPEVISLFALRKKFYSVGIPGGGSSGGGGSAGAAGGGHGVATARGRKKK